MFFLRRPSALTIDQFSARQAGQRLSYDFVAQTRTGPFRHQRFNLDHSRVLLGQGTAVFERAKAALDHWQMFPPGITQVYGEAPAAGLNVAILYWAAAVRLWMLFPARVVYTFDEVVQENGQAVHRYGFANGTLPDHAERGEERFMVEWRREDDSVWYDLLAISQPAHWLARLGYFYSRYEQARFRRLSGIAMQRAVDHEKRETARERCVTAADGHG